MGFKTKSIICVPIKDSEHGVVGVLQVLNKVDDVFLEEDEQILETLMTIAGSILAKDSYVVVFLSLCSIHMAICCTISVSVSTEMDIFEVMAVSTSNIQIWAVVGHVTFVDFGSRSVLWISKAGIGVSYINLPSVVRASRMYGRIPLRLRSPVLRLSTQIWCSCHIIGTVIDLTPKQIHSFLETSNRIN